MNYSHALAVALQEGYTKAAGILLDYWNHQLKEATVSDAIDELIGHVQDPTIKDLLERAWLPRHAPFEVRLLGTQQWAVVSARTDMVFQRWANHTSREPADQRCEEMNLRAAELIMTDGGLTMTRVGDEVLLNEQANPTT